MLKISNFFQQIKNNYTILIVVFAFFITVIITSTYNKHLVDERENYKKILNNIYFKKVIEYVLDDLNPKYVDKVYKVEVGDSFQKMLLNHGVNSNEIALVQKALSKKKKLN